MEILISKISESQSEADNYNGVIAYGKASNGKTYVLCTQPPDSERKWFVICQAKQTRIKPIFKPHDEMGDGLVFDYYDEAIEAFQDFLNEP